MKKTLYDLLLRLREVSGNEKLTLNYNSVYGGYRLEEIGSGNGVFGENGCEARLTSKEMCIKIKALIAGIKYEERIKK